MKTVCLHYPDRNAKSLKQIKKFKVAASTKGSSFRYCMLRDLGQFYNKDYFFLIERNDRLIKWDETKTVAELTEGKKLTLRLVFSRIDLVVKKASNQDQNVSLDMMQTAGENLRSINEDPKYYTFAFRPVDDSFYRITCNSLSLVSQGWFGEQLFIVRRVLETEKQDIRKLFDECIFTGELGLNIMDSQNWIETGAMRLIADKKVKQSRQAQKRFITQYIPNNISIDDQLWPHLTNIIEHNQYMSQDEARQEFIKLCTSSGGQCCFIDKVQFLIMDGKWRMTSQRFLYISPTSITITKDLGTSIIRRIFLSQISNVEAKDGVIIISFHNIPDKWRIKSTKNKEILYQIFLDVMSFVPKRIVDSQTKPLTPTNSSASISFIPNSQISNQNNSTQSTDLSDPTESVEFSSKELQNMHHYSLDEFKQETAEEGETIESKVAGLSQLILPSIEERDKPFNVSPYVTRDLSCVQMVSVPEKQIKNGNSDDDDSDTLAQFNLPSRKKPQENSFFSSNPILHRLEENKTTKNFFIASLALLFMLLLKVVF